MLSGGFADQEKVWTSTGRDVEQLLLYEHEEADTRMVLHAKEASTVYKAMFRQLLSVCLLYTSPSPRDLSTSRMPSSA